MDVKSCLERFCQLESTLLEGERALQIVSWDRRANTPAAAGADRGHTVGYLSDLQHQLLTGSELRKLLDTLAQPEVLETLDDEAMRARIRLVKRDSDRMTAIPRALYAEFAVLQTQSEAAWEQAKRNDDWPLFRPFLQKMFDYTNRFIDLWGYEGSRYNALVGHEEEGMTAEKLDELFSELQSGIVPLVKAVRASGIEPDDSFCHGSFPIAQQRELSACLLELIGFRLDWGVLAESEHPYTTSFGPHDVRLTTHYYESEFLPALFSTLHEGGHGLYEQCIGPALHRTRAGCGLAGGMHESVSRFWENMVGRSLAFWQLCLPRLQQLFPAQLGAKTPQDLYRAVNKCGQSFTRIEADELTYNLHIMLRCELERDVFDGRVQVGDLPELWREKMRSYLGLTPPNDALGILQDIQWSMAQFGYFPSYALGNMYNAQYTAALRRELDFDGLIRTGQLHVIRDAMRDKLYCFGSVRTPAQTIMALTGEELSARFLVQHLTGKFRDLYHLA